MLSISLIVFYLLNGKYLEAISKKGIWFKVTEKPKR